jgi:hypothetical protein
MTTSHGKTLLCSGSQAKGKPPLSKSRECHPVLFREPSFSIVNRNRQASEELRFRACGFQALSSVAADKSSLGEVQID